MKRMHPLHNANMIAHEVHMTGQYFDNTRRTGRSTTLALRYIAQAMDSPHTPVRILDHSPDGLTCATVAMNRNLTALIEGMLNLLGLKHFTVSIAECFIVFGEVSKTAPAPTAKRPRTVGDHPLFGSI